jgi:anti-anti-sigma factor
VKEQVMALKVRITQDRSFSKTVHLDGRLDNESAPILDRELDTLAGAPVDVLVFDLTDLEYISSAGLRSIFGARMAMAERSGRIVLVNPQPQVQKVFDIVKATDIGAVFTNVQELDRYLDAMQRKVLDGQ